jgi:peptide/nickel transport system substrate-binding protein
MFAVGGLLLGVSLDHGQSNDSSPGLRQGGTFRIAHLTSQFTSIDPALALWGLDSEQLVDPTCGQLLNYADKSPPEGLRIVPEAASRWAVSDGGKRYTFTIRRGLRFSDGKPVTAQNFARAFVRVLAPSMQSPGASFLDDVVGAGGTPEGRLPSGIVARGRRLVIRLTRSVPDFPARMTLSLFCAVPANLPIDPEGVRAPLPAAGPYYVAEYVPGRRLVLRRNRFYRGPRPQRVSTFLVDFRSANSQDVIARIKAGSADWGMEDENLYFPRGRDITRLRSQYFSSPGHALVAFVLNTRRPLFRNNAPLRRAVNFAVDRPALVRAFGGPGSGQPTDQYLPPGMPAFDDAHMYPLRRPKLATARRLASGHLRGGVAVLYVRDDPNYRSMAQILDKGLSTIGLRVQVKVWPRGVYYQKLYRRGEPWDIGQFAWLPDWIDPYAYLNLLFHSESSSNPAFGSAKFDRRLDRAARLRGAARYRAYGALDVQLARAAPAVAAFYANVATFVSRRVDPRCVVRRPYLDLAAVCLKR